MYVQYTHTLQVHTSTSGIVIHYIGSGCQSPNPRVKGSWQGHTGVTMLPRGNIGGLEGSSFSPGVIDAEYSLSSPKTDCAW